jgi:hypothetical protein
MGRVTFHTPAIVALEGSPLHLTVTSSSGTRATVELAPGRLAAFEAAARSVVAHPPSLPETVPPRRPPAALVLTESGPPVEFLVFGETDLWPLPAG